LIKLHLAQSSRDRFVGEPTAGFFAAAWPRTDRSKVARVWFPLARADILRMSNSLRARRSAT